MVYNKDSNDGRWVVVTANALDEIIDDPNATTESHVLARTWRRVVILVVGVLFTVAVVTCCFIVVANVVPVVTNKQDSSKVDVDGDAHVMDDSDDDDDDDSNIGLFWTISSSVFRSLTL